MPLETRTFQDSASKLFNSLPNEIKLETDAKTYTRHRIHKWRGTRGKKLVPSHESEALEDKQILQTKTFSELIECLARVLHKITLYGRLLKYNYVG